MSREAVFKDFTTGGALVLMEHTNPAYLPEFPFRLSLINPDQKPTSVHYCFSLQELEQFRTAITQFLDGRSAHQPKLRGHVAD